MKAHNECEEREKSLCECDTNGVVVYEVTQKRARTEL